VDVSSSDSSYPFHFFHGFTRTYLIYTVQLFRHYFITHPVQIFYQILSVFFFCLILYWLKVQSFPNIFPLVRDSPVQRNLKLRNIRMCWNRANQSKFLIEVFSISALSHMFSHYFFSFFFLSLWLYSPFGPWPLFQFRNLYIVGRTLGRVISPSQGRYLHTEQHKHRINTQISMPRAEFEPTIPVFEWAKTVHVLDRAAIVIGCTTYIKK
jgi:hypothetical protein